MDFAQKGKHLLKAQTLTLPRQLKTKEKKSKAKC